MARRAPGTGQGTRRARIARLAALGVALAALVVGCATPPPAPTAEALAIVDARATSQTSVDVAFDAAADAAAADPSRYTILGPDGAPLQVLDALPSADATRVALVTLPQLLVRYTLAVDGVGRADGVGGSAVMQAPGGFVGSALAAPVVARAVALDARQVLVSFRDPATGAAVAMDDGATDPGRYAIAGGALDVLGAAFAAGGDRTRVIVTTSVMDDVVYTLEVDAGVRSASGVPLDPFRASTGFRGIASSDAVAPEIVEARALDAATVLVRFSEPMGPDAGDETAYLVLDGDGTEVRVSSVVLDAYATEATLTTWPMVPGGTHTVSATARDKAGNALAGPAASFRVPNGGAPDDDVAPRVVGANATGPTTVVVTFSEPVLGGPTSAENPANYTVTDVASAEAIGTDAVLVVQGAVLSANGTAVTLTTLSQSEIAYALRVTDVRDLAGNQIAGPDREFPYQVAFMGRGGTGTPIDTDGDGLSDAAEQAGWTVRVKAAGSALETRVVTSDPFDPDSDQDGVGDRDESVYLTDPRRPDTDGDGLSDFQELNQIYSEPTDQDSDGDGLVDGLEFDFFRTSPILDDTDGDQLLDGDEVVLANRNPRVADLPLPAIEVGAVDLSLDVRFTATSVRGTRELESRTATSTLTQSETQSFSNTDANSHEFFAKASAGGQYELGGDATVGKLTASFSVEAGYTGQWSSSFTRESSEETQRAFEEARQTEVETTREESVTREVVGASMRATVTLRSLGNIAFTISNVEVAAFVLDPENPARLVPIATLTPQADPGASYNLGPLIPLRGPLVFESSEVFPSLVEDLMRDPRGLIFKVANFDLTDEFGRNFAFTSQDINDRTAPLVLDFGGIDGDGDGEGDASARYRIATSAGRVIGDVNGDGVIDDGDRTVFDGDGQQVGITLREALEDVLGLTRYDEDVTPSATLDAIELERSYSVRVVGGVATLWRVGAVAKDVGNAQRQWEVLTPEGIDRSIDFDTRLLRTEDGVTLAFVQDLDGDRVMARWEYLLGCSDQLLDTDGDGVSDYDEIYVGWTVSVAGRGDRQANASCARRDSDLDGLDDGAERSLATDPERADSDGDGVSDFDEVNGYVIDLRFGVQVGTTCTVVAGDTVRCTSDPLDPDTDGDTVRDGDERRLGVDPTVQDGDRALDDDGDGLVNFEETDGWTVAFERVSTVPLQAGAQTTCTPSSFAACGPAPTSDPRNPDTDGDGLRDDVERALGLHPRLGDTDGDGVTDRAEVAYVPATDTWTLVLDPLDADVDDDLRSDGAERGTAITVRVAGEAPYTVFSDPLVADADLDTLVDGPEAVAGTDPTKFDTDEDGTSDVVEVGRTLDADASNDTDPLAPDQLVRLAFDGRGVKWTNGLICGVLPAESTAARFTGDLRHTINAVQTTTSFDRTWTEAWDNVGTWTVAYRGGAITAAGENLRRLDGAVIYNIASFNETVVNAGAGFQALPGVVQQEWNLQQQPENNDVCAMRIRFTITPIMN